MLATDSNRSRPRAADRAVLGRSAALALGVVFLLTSLVACGPGSPAEEVTAKRAKYEVELVTFLVQEPEMPAPPMDETVDEAGETGEETEDMDAQAEPADDAAAEGEMDGDAVEPMEPVWVDDGKRDVLLDLLLQSNTYEQLPGVTIDVTHADAESNEKGVYRVWIETADMTRGTRPFTHTLEDVEWEEGDKFAAEIRSSVPESERGEYREYAEAG